MEHNGNTLKSIVGEKFGKFLKAIRENFFTIFDSGLPI